MPARDTTAGTSGAVWGVVRTRLQDSEILARASALARRGKLPGFCTPRRGGSLFLIAAYGTGFDHELHARVKRDESGARLEFHPRVARRMPIIMGALFIVSIWPGLPLTDSLLRTYFPSYSFSTWMWYLPLTVLPLPPLLWKMWKSSRAAAMEHGRESIELLRAELEDGAAS